MTTPELLAKIAAIEADPKNRNTSGGTFLYTKSANRKLDDLRRQVAANMRRDRITRGETVNDSGYSGRQTNRR